MSKRPEGWECPWCGPHGVPVNFSLPLHLRICDECQRPDPPAPPAPPKRKPEEELVIEQLRGILRSHVQDFHKPWPGMEFGKTIFGNSILGALADYGCDPKEEMKRATTPLHPEWEDDYILPYAERIRRQELRRKAYSGR